MSDPLLDEDGIVQLLQSPIEVDNIHRLQAGAMQALLDIYDRKVTRQEFINLSSPVVALFGQAAKYWMLNNIKMAHDERLLDDNQFQIAESGMQDLMRKQCETVIEIVRRLQSCPTSLDKIH